MNQNSIINNFISVRTVPIDNWQWIGRIRNERKPDSSNLYFNYSSLSGHHAEICCIAHEVIIKDYSRHGTAIWKVRSGKLIELKDSGTLEQGDIICMVLSKKMVHKKGSIKCNGDWKDQLYFAFKYYMHHLLVMDIRNKEIKVAELNSSNMLKIAKRNRNEDLTLTEFIKHLSVEKKEEPPNRIKIALASLVIGSMATFGILAEIGAKY